VASYDLQIRPAALKELQRIPLQDRRRLTARIHGLAGEPRPVGSEKMSGVPLYRIRQGKYRVTYEIADREGIVTVFRIAHRRDAYR
jgi:mRNA interferase RelE/StbE